MEEKKCPVCDSENTSFFSEKNGYIFLRCDVCNLVLMDSLPDAKKLIDEFYSEKSGYHFKLVGNLAKIKKYKKKFTKVINKLTDLGITGNLLDVGCSNGEFLILAKILLGKSKEGLSIYDKIEEYLRENEY